jgi:DNA-binding IclR family transcriptional regulator
MYYEGENQQKIGQWLESQPGQDYYTVAQIAAGTGLTKSVVRRTLESMHTRGWVLGKRNDDRTEYLYARRNSE